LAKQIRLFDIENPKNRLSTVHATGGNLLALHFLIPFDIRKLEKVTQKYIWG
jgi:hypothetical protein